MEPLTVKQAATRLGLSKTSVLSLCHSGELNHYRIGPSRRRIMISADDVVEYLKRSRVLVIPVQSHERAATPQPKVGGFQRLRAAGFVPE